MTTLNPDETWKLKEAEGMRDGVKNAATSFKCPFTGMTAQVPDQSDEDSSSSSAHGGCPAHRFMKETSDSDKADGKNKVSRTFSSASLVPSVASTQMSAEVSAGFTTRTGSTAKSTDRGIGLSSSVTKTLFPYHVVMNHEFQIIQVGRDLSGVLKTTEANMIGEDIFDVFDIIKPLNANWDWNWLSRLEEEAFTIEPVSEEVCHLSFKTSVVLIADSPPKAMLVLTPDANSLNELRDMNLTISDLPVHGAHRDAVFLREHLSTQMNNALNMEKLTKSLKTEKELLESLIPEHAARSLRSGEKVQPMMHENVTMIFSDIVGFTKMCKQMYPWEVIGMLNRLYCIMDFLAERFNLFKVETIGACLLFGSVYVVAVFPLTLPPLFNKQAIVTWQLLACRKTMPTMR